MPRCGCSPSWLLDRGRGPVLFEIIGFFTSFPDYACNQLQASLGSVSLNSMPLVYLPMVYDSDRTTIRYQLCARHRVCQRGRPGTAMVDNSKWVPGVVHAKRNHLSAVNKSLQARKLLHALYQTTNRYPRQAVNMSKRWSGQIFLYDRVRHLPNYQGQVQIPRSLHARQTKCPGNQIDLAWWRQIACLVLVKYCMACVHIDFKDFWSWFSVSSS